MLGSKSEDDVDDATLLKQSYLSAVEQIKVAVADELRVRLGTWLPDPQIIAAYPFMVNPRKLCEDYLECMDVVIVDDLISLVVDKGKLKQKGLPENLHALLEYGDEVIPPFPHTRPVLQTRTRLFSQAMQAFRKVV